MLRTTTLLLPLCLMLPLAGCKSGPAKVCAKIDELANKASTEGDEAAKLMARKMKDESSTCVTRMQSMADKDPEKFAKASSCIEEATQLDGVVACFFKATFGDKPPAGAADAPAAPTK